jgi:hypothetical protein
LIADAIRDVTKRGDLILDPFGGAGTVIIAAEKTGRRAGAIEIDCHYCDVAIRRWETFTGKAAVLAATSETFEDVAERRENERSLAARALSNSTKDSIFRLIALPGAWNYSPSTARTSAAEI